MTDDSASTLTGQSPPTSESSGWALELRGLRRLFGDKVAVNDLDLQVPHGSFFGMVGPNGAGKTTALSMAVGLLRPSAGAAFVHGVDVWSDQSRPNADSACYRMAWRCPNASPVESCSPIGGGSANCPGMS